MLCTAYCITCIRGDRSDCGTIGVNGGGYREILGVSEGGRGDAENWRAFLRHLEERGLKGVPLVTSDKCLGLVEALGEA